MTHGQHNPAELSSRWRPPIAILGVPFDNVTQTEAIELIQRMIASAQPHYLVTPNVDFLVQARQDIELRRILFEAHLVLCDGTPLVWASRLLGNPLPERIAGADLVPLLIDLAERRGYRLFLLGATPESSSQAVHRLRTNHPNLVIAGHYSPPFGKLLEMDHAEIKRRIAKARPDLLLVSFGCPKQEKWIAMHYRRLGVPVVIGVGATIDFLAGQVRRAPVWMQRSGTEWLFRLAQEPRRLMRRYAKDLWAFGGSICLQWWQLKLRSRFQPRRLWPFGRPPDCTGLPEPKLSFTIDAPFQAIQMPERFDLETIRQYGPLIEQQLAPQHHWLLDMSQVGFIDSTGIGFLIKLHKKIRVTERRLILLNSGLAVRRAVSLMRLDQFFLSAPTLAAARSLVDALANQQCASVSAQPSIGVNTLAWHGEITAANAELIWDQTSQFLKAGPRAASAWTIDLADVRFIDSTGLGLMVRLKKLAQQNRKTVLFANLQPAVRNVVHLAWLEPFLLELGVPGERITSPDCLSARAAVPTTVPDPTSCAPVAEA